MINEKRYSLFVGGNEVNDYLMDKLDAEILEIEYQNDGYDDTEVYRLTDKELKELKELE